MSSPLLEQRRHLRIALVTTTHKPGASILSFVAHHLRLGIEHIFIFCDGFVDGATAKLAGRRDVTLIPRDAALECAWRELRDFTSLEEFVEREVMARQILNAGVGVALARDMGMSWLIHLDSDELFIPTAGSAIEHFARVQRSGATEVIYLNHEAVPESFQVEDFFREVTLFKTNPSLLEDRSLAVPFIAYQTGKAAARIDDSPVSPWGVHRFRRASNHRSIRSLHSSVLHYPSCGFSRFVAKYRMLGRFDDKWFGQLAISDAMSFHAAARDAIAKDDLGAAQELYQRMVMLTDLGADLRDGLLREGRLQRIEQPAFALVHRL